MVWSLQFALFSLGEWLLIIAGILAARRWRNLAIANHMIAAEAIKALRECASARLRGVDPSPWELKYAGPSGPTSTQRN